MITKMLTQIFDPDGDLVLVLSKRFREDEQTKSTPTTPGEADAPPPADSHARTNSLFDELSSSLILNVLELGKEASPLTDVGMLVSSKHMMLASPVFKAMLRPNFREGETLRATGQATIPLPEDHLDAFVILLDIIHGRSKKIPRVVPFEMLLSLAILIDKYRLHELTRFFAEIWLDAVKEDIPTEMTRELVPWLVIAWVFGRADEFRNITRILERESQGRVYTKIYLEGRKLELPLPGPVMGRFRADLSSTHPTDKAPTDAVEKKRASAIAAMLSVVESYVDNLQKGRAGLCGMAQGTMCCEGMILGTILMSAAQCRLWPIPRAPYYLKSCNSVEELMKKMVIKSWCGIRHVTFAGDTHGVKEGIAKSVEEITSSLCGLELDDFKFEGENVVRSYVL
ncbi:hypothetical protein BP6252_13430 [Coleophoma cylindrospora]|uniref:BTB domain-containing protein n=1 Tax=Coleophoma cylindrospora TaxID=1849047 RepID=A0A3D8Q884_9HELO|nr:hypothetical protein BP6252_13430 [Coleophoma cylindrospora]